MAVIFLTLDKSKKDCYFADFGQVNFLLDKTPLGDTGCLSKFLGSLSMSPAHHPSFSDLLRSPPALSSTPATFGCLLFLMFRHPVFLFTPFPNTVSKATLCSTCVTYRMLCHAIGHQVLPTQPLPGEAEDFPRGDNHPKHVPLLTYLA